MDELRPGAAQRVRKVRQRAGGKGVDVARVLHALGDAVVAALALGLSRREPWPEILRRAVALSGAAVLGPCAGDLRPRVLPPGTGAGSRARPAGTGVLMPLAAT